MARVFIAMVLLVFGLGIGSISCDSDEEVLLALKQGLLDGSGAMRNWIAGTGFCNWTGIQCDQQDHVESIILPNRLLQGSLTLELGRLQHLKVLNLELNNLTGSIPQTLENCSSLANISLGSNQLSGRIPLHLDRLPGLQRLDLWNNLLQGPIPASLGNATRIDYFSLGQNFLSGAIPPELGRLSRLQILRLFTNNFVGSFPVFFTNCTNLQIMSIRNNSLTGFIPPELDRLVLLQQLRIQSNLFEGSIPPHIGNMTSLYYIDISSNRLSGNIPRALGSLANLQELYLNNNTLSGRIPEEMIGCRSLGTLDLSHNQLEGPLPQNIGSFGLTNLTLDHNIISGSIPPSFGNLRLINLDLSHNRLSGSLPSTLASLKNIQLAFNLAYNSLSGRIPAWLGDFQVVQNISLQGNNFSGEIPESLGDCVGLQSLDLSLNRLTGSIPSSLGSLRFLVSLNLSMNDLEGRVPDEGSLKSFTEESFAGNARLCGAPVNRTCDSREAGGNKARIIIISASIGGSCFVVILVATWLTLRCCFSRDNPVAMAEGDDHAEELREYAGPLMSFTAEELRNITDDFSQENLIGVGGFCRVYKAKLNKEFVAVKLLRLDMAGNEVSKSFFAEVKILSQVRHRNLVRLLGHCWSSQAKALVLEFLPNGSLEQHLKGGTLDWETRFSIALGVANGMVYLHQEFDSPIIHCDLKPANVLLDLDFQPHVTDFGISRIAQPDEHATISAFRGSIGYTPPEYGNSASITTKGDVYSYGILLLELVTGKSPTSGMFGITSTLQEWVQDSFPLAVSKIVDPRLGSQSQYYELEILEVIRVALLCTSFLPAMRPSMRQVLNSIVKLRCDQQPKPIGSLISSPSPYTFFGRQNSS
ncbi:LRR receptor-like serine/threonine-protein kinase FLS2 [Selaginella moellendorffii]|nr:LRR receptor-like serine/threonine-protein kinase FLS2 [Selaginella moellendorffii]|eukprot:XP_002988546.2 LRR receptor-like serine/threonine-protein kinase FLS2 [Selaginella moellendorffii]